MDASYQRHTTNLHSHSFAIGTTPAPSRSHHPPIDFAVTRRAFRAGRRFFLEIFIMTNSPIGGAGAPRHHPDMRPEQAPPSSSAEPRSPWPRRVALAAGTLAFLGLAAATAAVVSSPNSPSGPHFYSVGGDTIRVCVGAPVPGPTHPQQTLDLYRVNPDPHDTGLGYTARPPEAPQLGRTYWAPQNGNRALGVTMIDTNADQMADCGRIDIRNPQGETTATAWLDMHTRTVHAREGAADPQAVFRLSADGRAENASGSSAPGGDRISRQSMALDGGVLTLTTWPQLIQPSETVGSPDRSVALEYERSTDTPLGEQTAALVGDGNDRVLDEGTWNGWTVQDEARGNYVNNYAASGVRVYPCCD
jgi:hypothetical protein